MWPFKRKQPQKASGLPTKVPFKSGAAFFEMQCKYGHTELKQDVGVVALILDAREHFGAEQATKRGPDGRQLAALRVASDDGGFIVPAQTPSGDGELLKPGDVVIWVPGVYSKEIGEGMGDPRCGWVGLIRAKVEPEFNISNPGFTVLCEYN